MGSDSTFRTLYTFDEALQKLGIDAESFRQLLRYQWQRPERGQWIRACVDSRGSHYIATLDGALSQKPRGGVPALDEDGHIVPDEGHDDFASWTRCGSDHRTGYGAVFELSGVFVVSPQNVRWIAEEATQTEWPITNLLAVSPLAQTEGEAFPEVYFVIVHDDGPDSLEMPKDAQDLFFLAADVDRVTESPRLGRRADHAEALPRCRGDFSAACKDRAMEMKLQTPDWAYWLNLSRVPIKAACALSCDIDPRSLPSNSSDLRDLPEYRRRYDWATNAIAAHTLDTETDVERANYYGGSVKGCEVVTLAGFRAWGESLPKPLTFPPEYPDATPLTDGQTNGKEQEQKQPLDPRERTTLLCIIGALAKEAELDLSQPMKAGETVKAMLPPDVKLSARTIGEHLKKVRVAMANRAD